MLHAVAIAFISLLAGMQINLRELRLPTLKYNYRPSWAQLPALVFAVLFLAILGFAITRFSLILTLTTCLATIVICAICEWVLARINPRCVWASWIFRFVFAGITIALLSLLFSQPATAFLPAFVSAGIYIRNCPFGAAHVKNLCIETYVKRRVKIDFSCFENDEGFKPETKFAGRQTAGKALQRFDIRSFGVKPGLQQDQTEAIQKAIDSIGQQGGGILFFPKGRYRINKRGNAFLQINFSNITIEGETDPQGRPLATIVCCRPTVRGHKNPWLSPFMITTGERLQPSNEFWGADFKHKKQTFMQSNSLSDPGSDGRILTPALATTVIAPAKKDETTLRVADSGKVGKFVLLALYNTSADGNLIRDILGDDLALRPEWTIARRAGEEEAPSYQWLTEVKQTIDRHTIELTRPLMRNVDMAYAPVLFNAEMLENITIRNLRLTSKWSGLFRHHGFPLYFSIRQTQEMDYGWNAVNIKRVANGSVDNVVIKNFTNPLYITDSRNITVDSVNIGGFDGHQGIKLYCHACDNLLRNIVFTSHFADMAGGEGNAYGNVFADIRYLNPEFNPVDYDFHGFAPPPASPPADNLFTRIYGFRYMKHAGAITHLPSAAQGNTWFQTITEGERRGEYLFYNMTHRQKGALLRLVTAVGYAVAIMQKTKRVSLKSFRENVKAKLRDMDEVCVARSRHARFIPKSKVVAIKTTGKSQF